MRPAGLRAGLDARVGSSATYDFVAAADAVETYGLDGTALSLAVPLALVAPRGRKPRRQNFFAEMLPEGRMLSRTSWRLRGAEALVDDAHPGLVEDIRAFTANLRAGRAAGAEPSSSGRRLRRP